MHMVSVCFHRHGMHADEQVFSLAWLCMKSGSFTWVTHPCFCPQVRPVFFTREEFKTAANLFTQV